MSTFLNTILQGARCKCPKCLEGDLYPSVFSLNLKDTCENCGLDLSANDNADGPAVFLIFILGFFLVPLALFVDAMLSPPLYVHAILWGIVLLGLTVGMLKPIKSYIMFLQYKHLPQSWESDKDE